ncbi:transposase, partial [Cloacibacillus porcorum]
IHEGIQAVLQEQPACASQKGLEYCDRLFALERDYTKLTLEERRVKRLEQSKAVTDAFFAWASNTPALPKSALGRALHYALEQRPLLETFYLDGRLEISNNMAERSIKQFVIGRKNWLFSCSPKGAETSAVIYSIIERAKENHLKPYEYLKYILENMPNTTPERYHILLPWSKEILCCCKLKGQPDSMAGDNDESCAPASGAGLNDSAER